MGDKKKKSNIGKKILHGVFPQAKLVEFVGNKIKSGLAKTGIKPTNSEIARELKAFTPKYAKQLKKINIPTKLKKKYGSPR